MGTPGAITELLERVKLGDRDAWDRVTELIYPDLRRVAGASMRREGAIATLQPTDLVHEIYLRLYRDQDKHWSNRAHFLAVAARAMRHFLVDRARRKALARAALTEIVAGVEAPITVNLLDLDRALRGLQQLDERLSQIVELRYFAGLSIEETASVLRISAETVKRDWAIARAWLHQRIRPA